MKVSFDESLSLVRVTLFAPGQRGTINSACSMHVKHPDTEVYFGGMHARVTFYDLGIEVTMPPEDGNWSDGEWARAKAWEMIHGSLTPEHMHTLIQAATERGKRIGKEEARREMRDVLGLK